MDEKSKQGYREFIITNRARVNKYLNVMLWFFIITGPAVSIGVKTGHFHDITYMTCVSTSVRVLGLAIIHFVLYKKCPSSMVTGLFALTALESIIVYMSYSHINIALTWFLAPVMSLLFCEKVIFFYTVVTNYILMGMTALITAPYRFSLRSDFENYKLFFIDVIGGYTIETIILVIASYIVVDFTSKYYKELFRQYTIIMKSEELMQEKMDILNSMAEIYENVNLVDFVNNTELSLRNENQKKYDIDMDVQTHTRMNQELMDKVMPDQLEDFKNFTNITTVRARLANKKIISADFIDVVNGWFRAQYITVDSTKDGIPNVVIYTIRNVDEEKRREEHLIRISLTDEMTRLYNRRCYEEDLISFKETGLSENFAMFSVDVNGLKKVNDTQGHAAGDELIKGAANCLTFAVGNKGKIYRIGGDEFVIIMFTEEPEVIRSEIKEKASQWRGVYTDELTLSVGYATNKDRIELTVDEIEHMADKDMYNEKEKYYQERGIDKTFKMKR